MLNRILAGISRMKKTWLFAVSVILAFAIGYLDFATGIELSVSIFYFIPITLSAWFVSRRGGMSVSILSGVIWFFADFLSARHYSHPLIPYWNAFILIGSFAAVSLTLTALKKSMDLENELAVHIQKGLLPKSLPRHTGIEVAVEWKPQSFVSGDYYDFIELGENRIGICIGDVSGHGVSAALLMSNLQAAFRLVALNERGTDEVCALLNASMMKNVPTDKFATFAYCIFDTVNGILQYTNAGHPSPFLVRKTGELIKLDSSGTMLGVVEQSFGRSAVSIGSGDLVLMYTDGIIETKNLSGDMFGEDRLTAVCIQYNDLGSWKIIDEIKRSIAAFNSEIFDDDITLLAIKIR